MPPFENEKPLDFTRRGLDHLIGPEGVKKCDRETILKKGVEKITDCEIILQARRMKVLILRVRDARAKKPHLPRNPIEEFHYSWVERFNYQKLEVRDFHYLLNLYLKTLEHNPEETINFPRLRRNGEFQRPEIARKFWD